jgi:GNAT superfamily N-acetyltransferase
LYLVEATYEGLLGKAFDKGAMQHFTKITSHAFYSQLGSYWHLTSLAVSPKHHRRGIGQQLIAWGLGVASQEMVPVTLEASVMGKVLYSRLGFQTIARNRVTEDLEVDAMLWEPDAGKGRWLNRNGDGSANVKKR